MSTLSHPPARSIEERNWRALLAVRELWAALAIVAVWAAVAVSAAAGGDLVSSSGTQSTVVPSGVAVALFAAIATWGIAKHGFGRRAERDE